MDPKYEKKAWLYSQCICTGAMIFGFNLGVLNPSYKNVGKALGWGSNETIFVSVFQAILPIGCVVGSMLASPIWNKYGRRAGVFWISGFTILGSLLSCIPYNATFGIGRFFSGVASGMGLSLAPVFVMEISPMKLRAKLGSLIHLNLAFGLAISYCLGIPLPIGDTDTVLQYWWQFMYFFQSFMALFFILVFKFHYVYDSPKFYVSQGNEDMARLAFEFLFGESDNSLLITSNTINKTPVKTPPVLSELLCSKKYRVMLRIAIALPLIEQVCGINAVTFYSTKILYDISGDIYTSRLLTSALGVCKFLASFLIFFLIHKYGRKTLLTASIGIMGFLCIIFGLLTSVLNFSIYPSTVVMALHMIVYTSSYAPVLWIFIGEAIVQQLVAVGVASKFTFMIAVTGVFPTAVEVFGISAVFYFFAVSMVLAFVYGRIDLVETKGKTREEVESLLTHKKSKKISSEVFI